MILNQYFYFTFYFFYFLSPIFSFTFSTKHSINLTIEWKEVSKLTESDNWNSSMIIVVYSSLLHDNMNSIPTIEVAPRW